MWVAWAGRRLASRVSAAPAFVGIVVAFPGTRNDCDSQHSSANLQRNEERAHTHAEREKHAERREKNLDLELE